VPGLLDITISLAVLLLLTPIVVGPLVIPAVALVFPIRDAGNEEVLTVGTLVVVCMVAARQAAAACLLAFDTNFFGGLELLLFSCCSDVLFDSLSEDAAMPELFLAELDAATDDCSEEAPFLEFPFFISETTVEASLVCEVEEVEFF